MVRFYKIITNQKSNLINRLTNIHSQHSFGRNIPVNIENMISCHYSSRFPKFTLASRIGFDCQKLSGLVLESTLEFFV